MKFPGSETTFGRDAAYFLIFLAIMFLVRSLWTYPTEHSDAIQQFFYAAEILRMGDWGIMLQNHHTMRWSAMLPQTGLTWLLGTRFELFFIIPLLMFSLYVVLIVFSLRKTLNLSYQILLWAILFSELMSFHTSNQYLIVGIGVFCAFAGSLVLVRHAKRNHLATMLAAFLFFCAYGAHVTYLSFSAGGFLWLLFFQRKPASAMIFAVTILVLMLFETLIFNYLSGWQLVLGRIEALAHGSHVVRSLSYSPTSFDQLFLRWLNLPLPHLLLCLGFITAGPWLIIQRRKGAPAPGIIECTFMVGLCFAFAATFAVYSIVPLKPVVPLTPRYLVPFFPFASIMTVYMLSVFTSRVLGKAQDGKIFAASLVITLFLVSFPTYKLDFFRSKFDAFLWRADQEYSGFSEKFQQGNLILEGKKRIAFSMIARFQNPVGLLHQDARISVKAPSTEAKCVRRLNLSPLDLNYEDCSH